MSPSRLDPWWCLVLTVAAAAYLVALGGLHIPHIGDEAPYVEITRLTAESGSLLPLRTAEGLENTKPPLLFWLGIVSTDWGRAWSLWWLRLPIVLVTFLTAFVVYRLGWRLGGRRETGCLAALSYLAFGTTFQYGRPFLTNPPETLFLFLPVALAAADATRFDRWGYWIVTGLSVGVATLFKSFALVVPVAFAFTLWLLWRRGWRVGAFLRRDLPKALLGLAIALGCFALWPLLDPDPQAVWNDFVVGENLGKVGSEGGYLQGLVDETHGLHVTLLGPLLNAAFLALPLVLLAVHAWRGRGNLAPGAKGLWITVLAFVAFYCLPSHRQANYLLPIMPALAVLLGLAWNELSVAWLRVSAVPLVVAGIGLFGFLVLLRMGEGATLSVPAWLLAAPLAATVVGLAAVHTRRGAPRLFHLAVFLVYLSIAAAAAPLEAEAGQFPAETIRATAGRTVYVPSTFRSRHERHRFLLPGAEVKGYWRKDAAAPGRLYERGELVALVGPLRADVAPPGAEILGRRVDLRTRQTAPEILDLLLHLDLDVLLQQEIIVRRPDASMEGEER